MNDIAFQIAAIYFIGFRMVRVVKAWDVAGEHANSMATTHTL